MGSFRAGAEDRNGGKRIVGRGKWQGAKRTKETTADQVYSKGGVRPRKNGWRRGFKVRTKTHSSRLRYRWVSKWFYVEVSVRAGCGVIEELLDRQVTEVKNEFCG
jgi:hypothetical protein